ncbi:MAG: YnbE family lipoprotein [Rhodospirillaceae bacterium]|nr:YnbE family lipoprotein [Rhodospirillaceae bacterium]MDD9913051.1 YnbE family lipoprotein [Rhodospirillaceae bacterium]MDD9926158.1 YnbE family lipoprotein [Rhodospirillaceae bacterium]
MKLSFNRSAVWGAWIGAAGILIAGCAPEVQIRAPEKPIVINLNVKIEQEIRVKVEKEIDDLLLKNKDLF